LNIKNLKMLKNKGHKLNISGHVLAQQFFIYSKNIN